MIVYSLSEMNQFIIIIIDSFFFFSSCDADFKSSLSNIIHYNKIAYLILRRLTFLNNFMEQFCLDISKNRLVQKYFQRIVTHFMYRIIVKNAQK